MNHTELINRLIYNAPNTEKKEKNIFIIEMLTIILIFLIAVGVEYFYKNLFSLFFIVVAPIALIKGLITGFSKINPYLEKLIKEDGFEKEYKKALITQAFYLMELYKNNQNQNILAYFKKVMDLYSCSNEISLEDVKVFTFFLKQTHKELNFSTILLSDEFKKTEEEIKSFYFTL